MNSAFAVVAQAIRQGAYDAELAAIYHRAGLDEQRRRWNDLLQRAATHALFAHTDDFARHEDRRTVRLFRSPGRTEIGGNHTDHNHGLAIVGTLCSDIIAAVAPRDDGRICIHNLDRDRTVEIALTSLDAVPSERGDSAALVRGVAAALRRHGVVPRGFDALTTSAVAEGGGLSSSAAFESLVAVILQAIGGDDNGGDSRSGSDGDRDVTGGRDGTGNSDDGDRHAVAGSDSDGNARPFDIARTLSVIDLAKAGQYAENEYFGKPCGLEDQIGSLNGGMTQIDFADFDNIDLQRLDIDFSAYGLQLAMVDSGESHADLTEHYAAIPTEMRRVAAHYGKQVLRDVERAKIIADLPQLRAAHGDRSMLRALHFFRENDRVRRQIDALRNGDIERFLHLVGQSGRSSWMWLQNCIVPGRSDEQGLAYTLAITDEFIADAGVQRRAACRVHGGGFAGAVQVYIPIDHSAAYRAYIERHVGRDAYLPLRISPVGAGEIALTNR